MPRDITTPNQQPQFQDTTVGISSMKYNKGENAQVCYAFPTRLCMCEAQIDSIMMYFNHIVEA